MLDASIPRLPSFVLIGFSDVFSMIRRALTCAIALDWNVHCLSTLTTLSVCKHAFGQIQVLAEFESSIF